MDVKDISDRPPMDIICVLDTSGSMSSDNKLTNLLQAVDYIREELNEKDRMSVITFTNSAIKQFNLLKMTTENKQRTKSVTDQLRSGGGTCILSGMLEAEEIITKRITSNPVTTVFLLTDGCDPNNLQRKKQIAQNIRRAGASLFVYGFGYDHDSAHLNAIADAAEGSFTYISESDMVIDAFGGALGAETSIIATDLTLQIDAKPGVQFTSAFSGSACKLSPCGTKINVNYRNLMQGEERDVLLKCTIPSVPRPVQNYPLLTTSISYKVFQEPTKEHTYVSDDHCPVDRVHPKKLIDVPRNAKVDVQINREMMTTATKQGISWADQNNFTQATNTFDSAITQIEGSETFRAGDMKSKAFVTELRKAQSNCHNNRQYFNLGGRSEISEMGNIHSRQRRHYKKSSSSGCTDEEAALSLYQNHSSAGMQRKMASKKGF